MNNDLHIFFKNLKVLEPKELPFSQEELRRKIENRNAQEVQARFNKLFKTNRRKIMFSIGSIIATTSLTILMLSTHSGYDGMNSAHKIPLQTKNTLSKKIGQPKSVQSNQNDMAFNSHNNDEETNSLKSFEEIPAGLKQSGDFQWNEIVYDQRTNEFQGKQVFTVVDKDKKVIGAKHYTKDLEFADLMRIYEDLSQRLGENGFFGTKDIGYSSDNQFYFILDKTLKKLREKAVPDETCRMFELYSMITHKLANQSSGINFLNLTNSELEDIGIKTTDSSYQYTTEMIYEKLPTWIGNHGYPNTEGQPILIKCKNYVYWWCHKNVSNNKISLVDGYNEPDLSNISERNDTLKVNAVMARYTVDYNGWKAKDYNPLSPVFEGSQLSTGLHSSPLLYFGDGNLRKYYDMWKYYWEFNKTWRQEGIEKQVKDSLMKEDSKIMKDIDRLQCNLQANTLLPIKLIVPDTNNPKFKGMPTSVVYLMFVPTEAFLDKMPTRYRESLKREITALKKIESGELHYPDGCKGLSEQETFFDVCKIESDNIKDVKIYPNPAKAQAKIDFTLLQDRYLNITIYDINGKFIKEVKSWQKIRSGRINSEIDLNNLEKGMYLITISTEKGEKVVQRLVIN